MYYNYILDMFDIYICCEVWLDYYINYNYGMKNIENFFMNEEYSLILIFILGF